MFPLLLCACGGNDAGCRISGVVDRSFEGEMIYLSNLNYEHIDTAYVAADGTFLFDLGECAPALYIATFGGNECRVLVDSGVDAVIDFAGSKVQDGGVNDAYYGFLAERGVLAAEYDVFRNDFRDESLSEEHRDSARQEMHKLSVRMRELSFRHALENTDNIAGPAILLNYGLAFYAKSVAYYDSVVSLFPYAEYIESYSRDRDMVVQKYISAEGSMFLDFDARDWDGNDVRFSDYVGKGKYVLVDFWASWCGPCRGEIPNLNAMHDRYAGERFMVIGVDVNDNIEAAREAAKEDGVKYTLLDANDTPALDKYGIYGIPHIILFGPDGTILKRGLRGERIGEVLGQYLND